MRPGQHSPRRDKLIKRKRHSPAISYLRIRSLLPWYYPDPFATRQSFRQNFRFYTMESLDACTTPPGW
jgi:hypothetical protein